MKNFKLLGLLFITLNLFAQDNWENGKIEFENGTSLDCKIKNENWVYNPMYINYKNSNGEETRADLINIKSFEILNSIKYIKATVDIELSPSKLEELSHTREPKFEQRTVLLKTLIDGKADLFVFENSEKPRYFFRVEKNDIKPLIYKLYLSSNKNVVKNYDYVYQLNSEVNCGDKKIEINQVDYNESDLANYFISYNTCFNSTSIEYRMSNKGEFNFNLFVGLGFVNSKFESDYDYYIKNSNSNDLGFRVGAQTELVLPVRKKNWSIFAEFSYLTFNTSYEEFVEPSFTSFTTLKINKIDVLIGIKYYFTINEKSSIYIEGMYNAYTFEAGNNELITTLYTDGAPEPLRILNIELRHASFAAFGTGFKYDKKYNVGFRISTAQNPTSYTNNFNQKNIEMNLLASYTLF
jgi:hypothetical protein